MRDLPLHGNHMTVFDGLKTSVCATSVISFETVVKVPVQLGNVLLATGFLGTNE